MKYHFILYIPIIALIALLDFSFLSALPFPLALLSLTIVSLTITIELKLPDEMFFWAFFLGFFQDSLSFNPFGLNIVALLLAVYIARLVLNNFLTKESLYSFLAVNIILLIINFTAQLLYSWLSVFFGSEAIDYVMFFKNVGFSIVVNSILILLVFYFLNVVTKSLNPAFLKRKNV